MFKRRNLHFPETAPRTMANGQVPGTCKSTLAPDSTTLGRFWGGVRQQTFTVHPKKNLCILCLPNPSSVYHTVSQSCVPCLPPYPSLSVLSHFQQRWPMQSNKCP